jgi:hypothetical protein
MKKIFKKFGYSALVVLVIALIYSCLPRVWHKTSPYGTVLTTSDILPASQKEDFRRRR